MGGGAKKSPNREGRDSPIENRKRGNLCRLSKAHRDEKKKFRKKRKDREDK